MAGPRWGWGQYKILVTGSGKDVPGLADGGGTVIVSLDLRH